MNKYSLIFNDMQLEKKFKASTNAKSLIQCKMLAILLTIEGFLLTLNALLNTQYIASGFLMSFLLLYIGFYVLLVKYPQKIKYGILWFDLYSVYSPTALIIYIWLIDDLFSEKICLIVAFTAEIPMFILSQNLLISFGLYFQVMIIISLSCWKLLGFSWFLLMPPIFTISWISQKYQSLKLERIFFSESQTNECLATVLRRICKEKIMIFTYDGMNIKYQEYLLNDESKKYFEDRPLNEILSNIFVTCQNQQVSISSYIHRNIISNQNEEDFYSEAFQGYYLEKKNKINIELYVHTTSKTFFTLQITEIRKESCFSKTKAKQLLQIQNKVLHNILPKYVEIVQKDLSLTTKIQQFYKFMSEQISFLRLHIICNSKNIQFDIKKFDLVQQISESFNQVTEDSFYNYVRIKKWIKNTNYLKKYMRVSQIQINFSQECIWKIFQC